jgi:hypothetical protein
MALLGRVLTGCNTKALTLSVCDWLNTRRRIGLCSVDHANLDRIAECQRSLDPLQVLLLSHTANSQMNSTHARRVQRASHRDVRYHQTLVTRRGYADPLSIQQELKCVHDVWRGLTSHLSHSAPRAISM